MLNFLKLQFYNIPQKRATFIFGIHKALKNLDLLIPKETDTHDTR